MASPSKEEEILKLILENSPLKEWHFNEIVKKSKVTKAVANKWLKKYVDQGILKRIKTKGNFPYFTVGSKNPNYISLKKLYAYKLLHESGLIPELMSEELANTIIIFGSFAKGDWYKDSDIDIFVLGKIPNIKRKVYEEKIGKRIEVHEFKNLNEIKKIKTGLINNVLNGLLVKGRIQNLI